MRTTRQQGHIYKKQGHWYVRFRQLERQPDGQIQRVQRAKRLAPVCPDYRTKKSVEPLRDSLFEEIKLNSREYNPQSTMTISEFVDGSGDCDGVFFKNCETQVKPSVLAPYQCNWRKHLKPLCGNIRLRDFRTCDGQRIISELAGRDLGRNTVKRLRNLLSGIFSEAIRQGTLNGTNPIREVRIPSNQLRAPEQTYAYSIDEIRKMLMVFEDPIRTVIAVFAFTGMRKGEVEALSWEQWRDGAIWVEQSAWRGQFTEPKSEKSKAPVPVIGPLARFLEAYKNGREYGLVFRSAKGTPQNLDNVAKRIIRPRLDEVNSKLHEANPEAEKIEWHGWHAFRRGLATNLKQIGVDDKTIQAILRHADYTTTMNSYVKAVPDSVQKAMEQFEQLCTNCAPEAEARIM